MHLLIIAMLPAITLMFVIYQCDRVEKEPVSLVLKVMGLGMLVIIPVLVCELAGEFILSRFWYETELPYLVLMNFIVVGISEEFWKRFIIRKYIWKKKDFNYRFDAIVYCVASSLGFALLENVLYVLQSGFGTGVARAVLSVPGHCTFAVFMGFFLGEARFYEVREQTTRAKRHLALSLWIPVLQHGFFDFCLSVQSIWFILIFLLFVLVCDIVAIIRVIRSEKQDMPFYVLKEGDRWIQNPVWMQMAATAMHMEVPDIQYETEQTEIK